MQVELHRQTRHEIADFKSLAYEIEIRNYSAYLLRFKCCGIEKLTAREWAVSNK